MNEPAKPAPSSPAQRYFPFLAVWGEYRREWLPRDLLAGVTVCIVMIPSVIAYAGLLGIRPEHGLYAALVPLVLYAVFGSSRQVIVGPDIAISLLMASAIGPLAVGDAGKAAAMAATLALLTGLLLLLGVVANLGAVADFLSKPVLVGYMTGAALILMASQLSQLFGVSLKRNEFFPRLTELAGKLGQAHAPTLVLGLGLLVLLFVLRWLAPRIPSALAACVVAIVVSRVLGWRSSAPFQAGYPGLPFPG